MKKQTAPKLKGNLVKIGNRLVGEAQPVFIICEAGVTNYGEFDIAIKQIDAAVEAKADAVKFQLWRTENLVSKTAAKKYEKELGYNWFERLKYKELSQNEIKKLSEYAKKKGILFFATPHDDESITYLDKEIGVSLFKIGSGEAHNHDFLKKIAACKKPVIISFGFQSNEEVKRSIDSLKNAGVPGVIALHCVTKYPTPYEFVNLRRMDSMKALQIPFGLSDHSVGFHALIASVARGAQVLEKHLTFDKKDPRSLDNPGALLPEEFKEMVKQVREVEKTLLVPPVSFFKDELAKSRAWAGQSIVAKISIPKGTKIDQSMIVFKRPFKGGLGPEDTKKILGKKAKVDIPEDEQITLAHLV